MRRNKMMGRGDVKRNHRRGFTKLLEYPHSRNKKRKLICQLIWGTSKIVGEQNRELMMCLWVKISRGKENTVLYKSNMYM